MRRLLTLALLAGLLACTGPARAQSDDGAPNRLSLEALTAPSPGGSSGGGYRRSRSGAYHRGGSYRPRAYRGSTRRYGYSRRSSRSYHARSASHASRHTRHYTATRARRRY